jgi:hypothetical protein
MSEKILETLMQLFAIIAKPQSNDKERRGVVEVFLKRMQSSKKPGKSLKRVVLQDVKEPSLSGSGSFVKRSTNRVSSIRNREL